jgi:hypothetical protein
MSVERVVVLLHPVFAGVAIWLVGWLATNVPGAPKLNPTDMASVEIAVFVSVTGVVLKWLHGRQKTLGPTPVAGELLPFTTLEPPLAKVAETVAPVAGQS